MLQNAYLLAKIGANTAENEQHFAEFCQKLSKPEGDRFKRVADRLALRAVARRALRRRADDLVLRCGLFAKCCSFFVEMLARSARCAAVSAPFFASI